MQNLHVIDGLSSAALLDFLTLAETRSFQATADKQHISQPALSRRIKTLEISLGAELFDRRKQPVRLTKAGEAILPYVTEAIGRLTDGVEALRGVMTGLQDPVRLVATHTAAVTTLPAWLIKCGLDLSKDQVLLNSFRTERCIAEIRAGRADLGLCMWSNELPMADDLELKVICPDELIAVRSCQLKVKPTLPIPFLGFSPGGALGEVLKSHLTKLQKDRKFHIVFESPASEVLHALVVAGLGVAYLPRLLVERDVRGGKLKLLPWTSIGVKVVLIRLRGMPDPRIGKLWALS